MAVLRMARRKTEPYFPDPDEDFVLEKLRNSDMSDRALLIKLKQCEDDDGLIDPAYVAEKLNVIGTDKRTPAGTVSTRLSWMRRYGMIERVEPTHIGLRRKDGCRYTITPFGHEVSRGHIPASVMRELEKDSAGTQVAIMDELAKRAFVANGNPYRGRVVRRQFLNSSGARS